MKSVIFFALAAATFAAESPRKWTTRDGRTFDAELSAADGLRATFTPPEKPAFVAALDLLSPGDVDFIRTWRADWREPLIVPTSLAPWPAQAAAPPGEVRVFPEDAGVFAYESANFRITSDLKIPVAAINDLSRVFEATRSALIALPLGLHAGGERERYSVMMFRDAGGYSNAGGVGGSGGHYDGRSRRMLILLPNLGITENAGIVRLDYARNVFILKHEVTHQLLARWHRGLPMWLDEGICEFIASLPYAQGRYTLKNPGAGMRAYLLKWSKAKQIRLIPPATLMAMTREDWKNAVSQQEAYDHYNSSALLAYYFIQKDNGASIAGFIDAIRRGEDIATAEATHLLRGKTRDDLKSELLALGKKLGVEFGP